MATQEELAMLFARNLSLHNPPPPAPVEEPKEVEPTYTYSISQHYTHSAHVVKQPSRPASEPPQTDQLTVDIILARHGVDSSSLYPTQIDLFKTADASQQMRLIELWRICPPYNGGNSLAHNLWTGPSTSLEQEESMANMDEDTMSDGSSHAPLTPIQGGDARWNHAEHVEPYMASGYELLAAREYEQSTGPSKDVYSHFGSAVGGSQYKQSIDPVYKTVESLNRYPNVEAMENQYGVFQNYQFGGYTNGGEDEEML
ncbi:hypothetical protein DID88_003762 [Monilinia fructigena]|uniref:Uncharacterized protein n=1 Tax=Monilinia fructigena TaxID=38457 RepID=A0A395ISP8_9HELO|nr:hypothetical protein DID88_003762 [Monilinia fructigena]